MHTLRWVCNFTLATHTCTWWYSVLVVIQASSGLLTVFPLTHHSQQPAPATLTPNQIRGPESWWELGCGDALWGLAAAWQVSGKNLHHQQVLLAPGKLSYLLVPNLPCSTLSLPSLCSCSSFTSVPVPYHLCPITFAIYPQEMLASPSVFLVYFIYIFLLSLSSLALYFDFFMYFDLPCILTF